MIDFDDGNFRIAATVGTMQESASYASFLPDSAKRLLDESKTLVTSDYELGEQNMLNVLENLDLSSLDLSFAQGGEDVNPNDISSQPSQNVHSKSNSDIALS